MQPQAGKINNIEFPAATSVAFDPEAFLDLIRAHGLRFVHYRAMRDPVGLVDKYDMRRPDPSNPKAMNGMVYTKAGVLTALCLGNTKEVKASDGGIVDSSTAQFTPLTHYEDTGQQVFLAPYDRLELEEESVLVSRHELVEHSPTNLDRPKFPPVKILDCIDAQGLQYHQDKDFAVTQNGQIEWGDRNPGLNPATGGGRIYSIRYVYRPAWYVARMIHEIRMFQTENMYTGEKAMIQGPQSAIVHREYFFESEAAANETRASEEAPANGQIPAR